MLNKNRTVGPKKFVFIAIIILLLSFIFLKNAFKQANSSSATEQVSQTEVDPVAQEQKTAVIENKPADAASASATSNVPTANSEISLSPQQIMFIRAQSKVALSSIYVAEQAFFSEHNRYTTDLKAIGYQPMKGTKLSSKFGFLEAFNSNQNITNESANRKDSDTFISDELEYLPQVQEIELEKVRSYCQSGCSATDDKFEIILATNLDGDKDLDLWTINERKELIHVFDDLAP